MHSRAELYPWISAGVIAWGVLDSFFGYRIFRFTVTLLGGAAGAVFGHAAGLALGRGLPGEIGGLIAGALLGAGLAFALYLAAVFAAGFGFGLTLGILLLTPVGHMVALLSGGVLGVIAGFMAVKLQRPFMILSTALLGAFRSMLAATYFTAEIDWLYYCRQPEQLPALIDSNPWMLPAIVGLAAIGALAQFGLGAAAGKKKTKPKDE